MYFICTQSVLCFRAWSYHKELIWGILFPPLHSVHTEDLWYTVILIHLEYSNLFLSAQGLVCCFKLLTSVFVGVLPNTNWTSNKNLFVWQFSLDRCSVLPNSTIWGPQDKSWLNAKILAALVCADNRGNPYSSGL